MSSPSIVVRQGEVLPVTGTATADSGFTLQLTSSPAPEVSIYTAAGVPVAGHDGIPVTSYSLTPAASVSALYEIAGDSFDPGRYSVAFTLTAIGSDTLTRVFRPLVQVEVLAVPLLGITTASGWLRSLLDDEDPAAYYWSDAELARYLDEERHTVNPFPENYPDPNLQSFAYWSGPAGMGLAQYTTERGASILDASPGNAVYQARKGYRHWADDLAPVVYVSSQEATALGYAYTVDPLNGRVTFTGSTVPAGGTVAPPFPLLRSQIVTAAFDYFRVYEAAYTALLVALGQWGAVQSVSTATSKVTRAKLEANLLRISLLRRRGLPTRRPQRCAMS